MIYSDLDRVNMKLIPVITKVYKLSVRQLSLTNVLLIVVIVLLFHLINSIGIDYSTKPFKKPTGLFNAIYLTRANTLETPDYSSDIDDITSKLSELEDDIRNGSRLDNGVVN